MTKSRSVGEKNLLAHRIRRYASAAMLLRRHDISDWDKKSAREQAAARSDHGQSTASLADTSVVKASLLPAGSSLPVGLVIPSAGIAQPVQRFDAVPPPSNHEVSTPQLYSDQISTPPSVPQALQAQPVIPETPRAPAQTETRGAPAKQPDSGTSISDTDWNRLSRFMRGHKEKVAREKESPEYIQRQKEKAEQEAAKKEADAETRKRQDLARAGKLPKAQVVYLSPEDRDSSPISDPDDRKVLDQSPVDQFTEGPEAIELPEVAADAVAADAAEQATGDDISQSPAPIQKFDERTRPKQVSAKRPVQLTPGADPPPAPKTASEPKVGVGDKSRTKELARADRPIRPEKEAAAADQIQLETEQRAGGQIQLEPEAPVEQPFDQAEETPKEEFYQPQGQLEIEPTPVAGQESKETVEKVPFVESTPEFDTAKPKDAPAAKMIQLEPEAAVKPPSQEPKSPTKTDGEPKTEEKISFGQRLLGAARSLFQRQDEPAPIKEPTVSLAADEKDSREEIDEEISEQSSVEMPPDTENIQIPGRPIKIREQESTPQDASIHAPAEQPAQPFIQRAKDEPGSEVPESRVMREPAKPEPERAEVEYADELAGEPPLVSESEPTSEKVSQAGQPVDMPEEAIFQAVEETDIEPPPEKPEPVAKIEPSAPAPTISRKPHTVQAEERTGRPFGVQQKPEVISTVPPAPQNEIEAERIDQDDGSREPDMGIPAPVTTATGDVEDVNLRETVKAEGFGPEPDQADDIFENESRDGIQLPAAIDSDEGESAMQELPLQEVWPAQEVTPSPPSVITTKPSTETEDQELPIDEGDLPTLVIQAPVEDDVGNEAELRSTLEEVSPYKPTDSSIELLPPRRPRPQIAPVQRSEEPGDSDPSLMRAQPMEEDQVVPDMTDISETPEAIESAVQPIQLHEDEPLSRQTEEASDKSELGAPVEFQQEPPEKPASEAGFVQTEIGALPSDLWDYLGETAPEPPAPEPLRPKAPVSLTPATETPAPESPTPKAPVSLTPATETPAPESPTPKAQVSLTPATETPAPVIPTLDKPASSSIAPAPRMESVPPATVAPVSTPPQTFTDSPRTDLALDTIQRTETKSETSTPVLDFQTPFQPLGLESALDWIQRQEETIETPATSSTEGDQAEESTQSEPDYQDLARKILPIIKRKLSIEWERSRGRF